jgi:hypothetical protein
MFDAFTSPEFINFLHSLNQEINLVTIITWVIIATVISMIGGAIGGMILAGKDLGYKFAATLGSLFAPAGVIPALILGLLMLNLFANF